MATPGKIRIIGGQWRGRYLPVLTLPGVRPTPNRVRETLFNWLMPNIRQTYCLDAFAGSGALGFEALSRGANHVTMLDSSFQIVQQLKHNLQLLKAEDNVTVIQATLPNDCPTLALTKQKFNLVFLDPPFQQKLLSASCHWLVTHQLLAPDALIYLEFNSKEQLSSITIPAGWHLLKQKQTGEVSYCLFSVNKESNPEN